MFLQYCIQIPNTWILYYALNGFFPFRSYRSANKMVIFSEQNNNSEVQDIMRDMRGLRIFTFDNNIYNR